MMKLPSVVIKPLNCGAMLTRIITSLLALGLVCGLFCGRILQPVHCTKLHHRVKRIVGGQPAQAPPPDDPVVFARMYNRDARVEGLRNLRTGLYSFLGIRYAAPPIGMNRFTRPFYRRLEGDINATRYGPPCPQPDQQNPMRIIGNEDCLLLNVFTPRMPDESTGLPVYVWIHGGSFRYGSANQYGAEPLTQKGVLFVPVQYRLGSLGIIGESNKDFSGNLAMFDMEAALRWVTEYISFFGGDPKQIKVIGHGSGASSAMYLTMSSIPKGRSISGTVSMSGSAISQYALDKEPVQSLEEIATINECPTMNETEIVGCLRKKSVEDIILRDSAIETERLQGRAMVRALGGSVGFDPHVETEDDHRGLPGFIVREPNITLKEKKFRKVPLLIGVTKDETANGITIAAVTKIWGSAEKFLQSLLGDILGLKGLLNLDKITGEIVQPLLPGLEKVLGLRDYLKVPKGLSAGEVLSKLSETTTDILFNLPAVLSADLWSAVAPAYLYSFEHKGQSTGGKDFLGQLSITAGRIADGNATGHGDELSYLFDVNDIFGNPIPGKKLKSDTDLQARESILELFAKFASISPGAKTESGGLFQSFTRKGAPFIRISNKLEVGNDFRFCSLSIFGVKLEALKALTCEGLLQSLSPVTNVVENLGGQLAGTLGLGGLLGSSSAGTKPAKKKPSGGLGLLGL